MLILLTWHALDPIQIARAQQVGVAHPERIRLLLVDALPLPEDSELRAAAIETDLFSERIEGMTLGYGILLIRRCVRPRLVSHECRHVYQVEQAGSLANFLPVYLRQIADEGYDDAPLERDAYAEEFD